MSLVASIKKLIPIAVKQPLRDYVDGQKWRRQEKLAFDVAKLLPCSQVDIAAIMNDRAIGEAFTQGFFPAAPAPEACSRCDYVSVCGPGAEERAVKRKPPIEALAYLRGMR